MDFREPPRSLIVFVGHYKDRLIESIRHLREYPIERGDSFRGQVEVDGGTKITGCC